MGGRFRPIIGRERACEWPALDRHPRLPIVDDVLDGDYPERYEVLKWAEVLNINGNEILLMPKYCVPCNNLLCLTDCDLTVAKSYFGDCGRCALNACQWRRMV